MHLLRWQPLASSLAAALCLAASGCSGPEPENPFFTTATGGAGGGDGFGGAPVDPELGEPCIEDAQCDDQLECTSDSCDQAFDRCRHHPEPAACDNGVHCDGPEVCDNKLGCIAGSPTSCNDDNLCTIDTCVEASQSCRHNPRDADGDGDPDAHCPPGGDCDDTDPYVSSTTDEVCGNLVDDDCDGGSDEDDCATPENDSCAEALTIDASGTFALSTFGASFDYPTSCMPPGTLRDVVAAVVVPEGPAIDLVARAHASPPVSVALAGQCGEAASELACGGTFQAASGGQVARLRARSVGGGPEVALPLYVTTAEGSEVTLDVSFEPATTAPAHETCGTAIDLPMDDPFEIEIIDAAKDLETACASVTGELVYRLTLAAPADLELYAISLDGDGNPSLSLRDAGCAIAENEITCHTAGTAHVFRHSLDAGDYYLGVSATAPTTISVVATLGPPTAPPADEDCAGSATLVHDVTTDVDFAQHQDDHDLGCFQAAIDVAYGLTIDEPSDVLLVQRTSAMDTASIGLADPGCLPEDVLACSFGSKSPLRARRRNLAIGDYRVVAESLFALPQQVTAFVRPFAPTQLVVFSDACADAITIPSTGGFFSGNTANLAANFSAGCDSSGGPANGAKDQILRLELNAPKRVVLDMSGSGYDTLLDVRKGTSCPGTEVPLGCTASTSIDKSYLDLQLTAGTYFVQIDGLGGATGPWVLDVHVVDP